MRRFEERGEIVRMHTLPDIVRMSNCCEMDMEEPQHSSGNNFSSWSKWSCLNGVKCRRIYIVVVYHLETVYVSLSVVYWSYRSVKSNFMCGWDALRCRSNSSTEVYGLMGGEHQYYMPCARRSLAHEVQLLQICKILLNRRHMPCAGPLRSDVGVQ